MPAFRDVYGGTGRMQDGKFVPYASQDEAEAAAPATPAAPADDRVAELQSQLDELKAALQDEREQHSRAVTQGLATVQERNTALQELDTLKAFIDSKRAEWEQERTKLQADFDSKAAAWETERTKLTADSLAREDALHTHVAELEARPSAALPEDTLARIKAVKGVGEVLADSILAALTAPAEAPSSDPQ